VSGGGTFIELAPSPLADALGGRIELSVLGQVYAEDALAAAAATTALGYSAHAVRTGLETFAGVPGRFEVVWRDPLVLVDYAHTPDALRATLAQARALVRGGRLWLVFGCGGERDTGKRPQMGRVAAEHADVAIVTSDNPRGEDPQAIIAEIVAGANGERCRVETEPDRRIAIERALLSAGAQDVVVLAGRGHEQVQWIGSRSLPFCDRTVARQLASQRPGRR
jgi:UDP-N-acetylmuramoyl-L-alanyl-D-glutamate--2,6-diaminopimelate ligase